MNRLAWVLLAAFLPVSGWGAIHVGPAPRIGFSLYSWKVGSDWQYSVLEGTVPVQHVQTVRSKQNRLKNITFLKGRLASLPTGETVYWLENRSQGFILPPQETIHQIKEYTEGLQLHLLLPEDIAR